MLVAVVVCVLLGRWQLDVWHDHRTDNAAAVTREDPVPLDDVLGPDAAFPGVGGRAGRSSSRDGGTRATPCTSRTGHATGATGVWAVTPVVTGSGSAIPVAARLDRRARRTRRRRRAARPNLVGLLQPSEDTGAPDSDTHDDVIPELSATDLLPRASYDLYGGYVVATDRALPSGDSAVRRGWRAWRRSRPSTSPAPTHRAALRNLLYAFQWWVFGAFAIFMWWRWVQEDVLGRRPSPRPR